MPKRILYMMHVDWDWIKQRPHFIAQHLSLRYDVLILYPFSRTRTVLSKNNRRGMRLWPFLLFRRKPALLHTGFRIVLSGFIRIIIKLFRPDFIWLTSPELADYFPKKLNAHIIYDCMDDVLGFDADPEQKAVLLNLEQNLLERAACVFCSSSHLQYILQQRAHCGDKCTLIRNAYAPLLTSLRSKVPPILRQVGRIKIGYIGTVSPWLDFDALMACVNHFDDLDVHLVGPVDRMNPLPWQENRIYFHGPVEHSALPAWAECFDILIIPFRITELTLSVDPVKLYEYIFFNKPIICVWYPEVDRFSSFVDFYSNYQELLKVIGNVYRRGFRPDYSEFERSNFLKFNTWENRVFFVKQVLEKLRAPQSDH